MATVTKLIEQIDDLLPQTQCGQCGYSGCLPYAEAVSRGEAINRCLPGGLKTLTALGSLLNRDVSTFIDEVIQKESPPMLASIRSEECIGCTKCIQSCPVDAIVGAAKQLHVILKQECTGCGLCIPPCPVDCIDYFAIEKTYYDSERARQRFKARQLRIEKQQLDEKQRQMRDELHEKRNYVTSAVLRVKAKKKQKSA